MNMKGSIELENNKTNKQTDKRTIGKNIPLGLKLMTLKT